MAFDASKMGNVMINSQGETCLWKVEETTTHPDYGSEETVQTTQSTIKLIITNIGADAQLKYPGEIPDYDSIAYCKKRHSVSVGDKIVRNAGDENERIFDVEQISKYPSYKELSLREI